jgi:predicted acyltransferase
MIETKNKRILALDVLRGITIAGMILVNNPGNGNYVFAPLRHARWIGLTPTDLVFPFFMFIMGISTYLSLKKINFELNYQSVYKILKRTIIIFAIGLIITWFSLFCNTWNDTNSTLPFFSHFVYSACNFGHIRILGVLQRLALSYGVAAFILLLMKHQYIPWLIALLYTGYFIILLNSNGFVDDHNNILYRVDNAIMGSNHMWNGDIVDPEGFLGTISSIAHVLIGFYVGEIIMKIKDIHIKVECLFVIGTILTFAGFLLSFGCPISKKIWTPSFSIITCGLASSSLALLIWIIDIKGYVKWSRFFESFGVNPLFLYTLSEILATILCFIQIPIGNNTNLYNFLCQHILQPLFGNYGGSLVFALLYVGFNWSIGYIFYKKRIYIKI